MNNVLNENRLFPAEPAIRSIANDIYGGIKDLPIVSPHGHTDPSWYAENKNFLDATSLFLTPDHYVLRMMHSRGVSYDSLGVPRPDGGKVADSRSAWRTFAKNFYLFQGAPSRLWFNHSMQFAFGIEEELSEGNADAIYDSINEKLKLDEFKPLALLDKANVEVISTTEFALDQLKHHKELAKQGIKKIITTYRPDDVTDPDNMSFQDNIRKMGEMTDCDICKWEGMIEAHRRRREFFRECGAKATDHASPTAQTADLGDGEKQKLLDKILSDKFNANDAALFRAQMLTEMAGLSVEDGMTMQIHVGVKRNTDSVLFGERGPDKGADIPVQIDVVHGLEPLLQKYGNCEGFHAIFFCIDESTYAREIAPMAGYWSSLLIGPPWWFHDSPLGIIRYLDSVVESAGFYNLAGFNDDTRALLSIPARHDVWRRSVSAFLAEMVAKHFLSKAEAEKIGIWLARDSAKKAYKID